MIDIANHENAMPEFFIGEWYSKNINPELIITENSFKVLIEEMATVYEFLFTIKDYNPTMRRIVLAATVDYENEIREVEIMMEPVTFLLGIPEAIRGIISLTNGTMLSFMFFHEKVAKARWN